MTVSILGLHKQYSDLYVPFLLFCRYAMWDTEDEVEEDVAKKKKKKEKPKEETDREENPEKEKKEKPKKEDSETDSFSRSLMDYIMPAKEMLRSITSNLVRSGPSRSPYQSKPG